MFGKKKNKDDAALGDAAETAAAAGKSKGAKATSETKPAKATKPAKEPKAAKPAKEPKAARAAKAAKPAKEPKAPKAPKVAGAAKAKSPNRKNSLAKGGPGFFAAHVEKIIMAGCLLAVAYLVYAGFSTPGYDTSLAPDKLERDAKDLLTKISQDHWEQISADPERKVEHDFATRASEARRPTDPNSYESAVWDPKPLGVFEMRGDPAIFPPEQLVVTTISGALAVQVPREQAEPYDDLEDAEPIRARQRGRDNSRTRRGGRAGAGSDGGYETGGYGSDGEAMGDGYPSGGGMMGAGGTGNQRLLSSEYNLGAIIGGAAGGMGGYGSGGMGGMDGGYGGMAGGSGGMGSGGTGGTGPIRDGLKDRNKERGPQFKVGSRAVIFNAIAGVVPHRKMVEEYLTQFQDSGSFVPQRDMPHYMSFELQRVEVTGNPTRDIQEQEWTKVSDALAQSNFPITQKWATWPPFGQPVPEVVDRRAYDPALTMPIPPLLVRDYRVFSKHPAVNWIWDARSSMVPRPSGIDRQPKESTILPGARPAGAGAGAMGSGGGYGSSMGGGGGYGDSMAGGYGSMGSGGGYGDSMGSGYGDSMGSGYGDSMGGGSMGSYGDSMGGGSGYGSMMGGMGSMGGGMMGGGMSAAMQPEFKMVRCYDMLTPADYAKVFRYRIRVVMRDPNYPENRMLPRPAPNTLKDEVWARVAPLIVKDDAAIKQDPQAMRSLRYTDWSQPSPPARVEIPIEVLVGEVAFDGPRSFGVEGKVFTLSVTEPTGNVVVTTMDGKTGARFAVKQEVRRGSTLAEKADVDLIVPSTRIVKVKKDQAIDARATIVDIRGGKPLAGDTRDDPLKDIGEMLILNRDGSVSVTNEFDDAFLYRMYTFADEHEASEKSGAGAGAAGGSMGGYGSDSGGGDKR